ncbi:MAG: beta 1-4 rhamnosyltransferase Cps2T, partial [Clostridium sp.]
MKSDTKKDFAIITNVEKNKFYEELKEKTGFENDPRIKFVGTVYNQELLKKIRENAFGYFHGHEVGGTNPSLLEALATTDLNILLDVGFNKEVAEEGAIYFSKDTNSLKELIDKSDRLHLDRIEELSRMAKKRISNEYSWEYIINKYETLFLR